MPFVRAIARPLLASVFVSGGLDALRRPGRLTSRAQSFSEAVAEPLHLPSDPELLVRSNGAVQVAAGSLLATGVLPRSAASLLAVSIVPTTLYGHAFWEHTDPQEKRYHRAQFFKNAALLGALMLAAADRTERS